jgi:hypothetical protein
VDPNGFSYLPAPNAPDPTRPTRPIPRKWVAAAVTAVVVIGVLVLVWPSSAKPSLKTAYGKVLNGTDFLVAAEAQWRQTLVQTAGNQVNVPKEARCYYIQDPASKLLAGGVACGPVRRASSQAGHVWDVASFDATPSGAGNGSILTSLNEFGTADQRPIGNFVRPDDRKPAKNADELALPPLPAADISLSQAYELGSTPLLGQRSLDGSHIVTPSGTLSLTATGTVSTAEISDGNGKTIVDRSPDGYDLRVFSYSFDPTDPDKTSEDGTYCDPCASTATALTLLNGSTRTNVATLNGASNAFFASTPQAGTWIVALKTGADAELGISVGSKELTLSVVSGKVRSDDSQTIYGLQSRSVAVNRTSSPWSTSYSTAYLDTTVNYQATVKTAYLTPFDPVKVWGNGGYAWLEVQVSQASDPYNAKPSNSRWVAVVDGKSYPLVPDAGNHGIYGFQVPATSRAATLRLQTTIGIPDSGSGVIAHNFTPPTFLVPLTFS